MKKIKIFQGTLLIAVALFIVYSTMMYNKANTAPVSAYVDETMYQVYTGKNVYEYYRTTLNETEKIVYDEIKESALQFETKISTQVDKLSRVELKNAFISVVLDHPEIFWIDSYSGSITLLNNVNTGKYIELNYGYDISEAKEIKAKIEQQYEWIIEEAEKLETDYEKVKFVHDKLIQIGAYNYSGYPKSEERRYQSIVSIFDTGDTVCAGFSYGFKFIMDNLGIEAISVENINEDEPAKSHVWNMVKIDDAWFNLDITWDYDSSEQEISYKNFLLDNDTFYKNHTMPVNLPNK